LGWNIWKPGIQKDWELIHKGDENTNGDILLLEKNYGYAKGNNYGSDFIGTYHNPDYLLIVNNDVTWTEDIVDILQKVLAIYPGLAVIAPRIIGPDGTEQNPQFLVEKTKMLQTYYRLGFPVSVLFYKLFSKFFNFDVHNKSTYEDKTEILFLDMTKYCMMGSCFMVKYSIFKEIGLFDPHTFIGAEEPILVKKLDAMNYQIAILPSVRVIHNQGETSRSIFSTSKSMELFEESDEYYLKTYCHYSANRLRLIRLGKRYYMQVWLPLIERFRLVRPGKKKVS
jgi:GT2 family glycosyltransferase